MTVIHIPAQKPKMSVGNARDMNQHERGSPRFHGGALRCKE